MNPDWNASWRWFPATTYMIRPGGPVNYNGNVVYLDYIDLQEESWIGDYEMEGWPPGCRIGWLTFANMADKPKKRWWKRRERKWIE